MKHDRECPDVEAYDDSALDPDMMRDVMMDLRAENERYKKALQAIIEGHDKMMQGIGEVKEPFIANVRGLFIEHLQTELFDARDALKGDAK